MTDTLLRSLRERLLDESEPLAGLLRKCLLLGAETGSSSLRDWARNELNGYDGGDVPEYRKAHLAISVDSMSGNTWVQNQIIGRLQLPQEAREFVQEEFSFGQPIEELEELAGHDQVSLTTPGLVYAQSIWNGKLGPYQNIVSLSYITGGSVIAGIIGQVRTKLVDLVADLTSDTPLSELPKKEQVDAAVSQRIGDTYNTSIQTSRGPVAIGASAKASTEGLDVEDALRLLDQLQREAAEVAEPDRAELLDALTDLRRAVEQQTPETGDVVKKAGRLRAIAAKIGVGSVVAAAGGATDALTQLALSGAFH